MGPKSTAASEARALPDRGDYAVRLDAEYWSYIDRVNGFFPTETAALPLNRQREIYDRMCAALHPGRPASVTTQDGAFDHPAGHAIAYRRYRSQTFASSAIILFFHGGGFVFGNLDSHDDSCADLCAATGLEIVSVDYRLAPEHPHPAAFEDALAALDWLSAESRPLILCGESAGATLAATIAHASRDAARPPVGQVLIYPALGGREHGRSWQEHARAPLLLAAEVDDYRLMRAAGHPPVADPTFEPLDDTDYRGLPPTVVVTAQCDPLSSGGQTYRDRILAAGGACNWREEPRLTHSFMRSRPYSQRAREAFARIVTDVWALAGMPAT